LAVVEFFVYWIHRALHTPALYGIHRQHHSFRNSLTPYAGFAFTPVDGILQALPYAIAPFWLPIHAPTHKFLLFLTGLWTAFIHSGDTRTYRVLLGPTHHRIHHETYKHNYGHYTQIMDCVFNTLRH